MQPAMLRASSILVLFCAGCAVVSIEPYRSEFFTRPPEIRQKDGGYHLRLYEPNVSPVGFSLAQTELVGRTVYVFVAVRHGDGSRPDRLIPLNIPVPADGKALLFRWRDPDGTAHPMIVRSGGEP